MIPAIFYTPLSIFCVMPLSQSHRRVAAGVPLGAHIVSHTGRVECLCHGLRYQVSLSSLPSRWPQTCTTCLPAGATSSTVGASSRWRERVRWPLTSSQVVPRVVSDGSADRASSRLPLLHWPEGDQGETESGPLGDERWSVSGTTHRGWTKEAKMDTALPVRGALVYSDAHT